MFWSICSPGGLPDWPGWQAGSTVKNLARLKFSQEDGMISFALSGLFSGYISPPTVRSYRTSIENIRDNIRDGMPSFRISGMWRERCRTSPTTVKRMRYGETPWFPIISARPFMLRGLCWDMRDDFANYSEHTHWGDHLRVQLVENIHWWNYISWMRITYDLIDLVAGKFSCHSSRPALAVTVDVYWSVTETFTLHVE